MASAPLRVLLAFIALALGHPLVQAVSLTSGSGSRGTIASWAVISPEEGGDFNIAYKKTDFDLNASPAQYLEGMWYFNANPGTQSPQAIQALMAEKYNIEPPQTLVYVGGCESGQTCNSGTDDALLKSYADAQGNFYVVLDQQAHPEVAGFDYLAVHIGGGELFFHWSHPITAFTLTGTGNWSPSNISNYRAYLATPLPGGLSLFLGAIGLLALRRRIAH